MVILFFHGHLIPIAVRPSVQD